MATSAPFDLGVVPVDVMKNDDARGKFTGTPSIIARVGYGVAVKAGASEAGREYARGAEVDAAQGSNDRSVPGERGRRLRAKDIRSAWHCGADRKTRPRCRPTPGAIPQAVAKGEVELGVFLTNVLLAPGVELAGPFPGDLQQELVFVGRDRCREQGRDSRQGFPRLSQDAGSRQRVQGQGRDAGVSQYRVGWVSPRSTNHTICAILSEMVP